MKCKKRWGWGWGSNEHEMYCEGFWVWGALESASMIQLLAFRRCSMLEETDTVSLDPG